MSTTASCSVSSSASASGPQITNYQLLITNYKFLFPLLLVLLASCAVGPNYKSPPVNRPSSFRGPVPEFSTNLSAELRWWEIFKDAPLQNLIREALTNNYDVRIAATRVEQARAVLQQNRGAFFPQVNYQAQAGRAKNATVSTPVFNHGATSDYFLFGGTTQWEIDFWGRVRRLNESARAQLLASEESRRDVLLSILSEVAQGYFQLLALDAELQIAKRSTNSFGESLRIFTERLQGGIVSKLEAAAAQAALASAAATVPDLERRIFEQENQLNFLVGRNPGSVPRDLSILQQQSLPVIPPGLPSSLLQRRPDVRQAEELVRSANAQIGVAVANFFPQFSLTALLGQVSPELSALTSGGANAWNIGANLAGPIFQGGRLVGQYRQARAARDEAALHYQSVVLNAFQEVSNALMERQKFEEQRVQQAVAVQAYSTAVQVALDRYVAGKASYYEVLQEQQLLFPAENALAQVQLSQLLAVVQLYRALGGGFSGSDDNAPSSK